jgi:MFS transporter, DHA2 family, multidrug resistance protein
VSTGSALGSAQPASRAERADLSDWLAVAAGSLGSLMALLDISIVNSALPTIQGEIGATGTEGTWIATSYLVAEIIIIPLAAWLARLLGLRTFLLIACVLFTIFSVLCGFATSLTMMIIGRVGQGVTGGALVPTAMTIIATRLPPRQQPIGTTLFGVTAILGPVIGPLVGGWITETVSWHYAFFINVPVCAVLIALLLLGLPHERGDRSELRQADWLGVAGLALGLGGLTVVLEEGQREQWFESQLIWKLTAVTLVGFLLVAFGQAHAQKPVIRLKLLLDRQFGSVALMATMLGMVLYGTSYVVPQFVSIFANYNALQAGQVLLLMGLPSLLLMPFAPLMMRFIDIRLAVAFGLSVMALSCWLEISLTAQSDGSAFTESQLLRGVGTVFVMLFLNQAAIRSVPPELAGDAAGLFNAARNIGGSVGLAMLATVQDQRSYFHARRLEEALQANALSVQDYVAGMSRSLGSADAAMMALSGTIQREALVMTYNDIFWLMTVGILAITPLVLFLRPLPQGDLVAMH